MLLPLRAKFERVFPKLMPDITVFLAFWLSPTRYNREQFPAYAPQFRVLH